MKQKYFEIFDSDTKRLLEEMSKVLRWAVEKIPFHRDIEGFRQEVIDCRKDTVWAYKLVEAAKPIFNDLPKMEKKLKAEILSDSEKQTLCNQSGSASRKNRWEVQRMDSNNRGSHQRVFGYQRY